MPRCKCALWRRSAYVRHLIRVALWPDDVFVKISWQVGGDLAAHRC